MVHVSARMAVLGTALVLPLAAPVLAQDAESLNRQALQEIRQGGAVLPGGSPGGAAGVMPGQMPAQTSVGDMATFTDAAGNRYVRAQDYDRAMSPAGATGSGGTYETYTDAQGISYYRLDAQGRPVQRTPAAVGAATGAGGAGGAFAPATASPTTAPPAAMQGPAPGTPGGGPATVNEAGHIVYLDGTGRRFIRVDSRNRVIGVPADSPLANMSLDTYPLYEDAVGNRYVEVDRNFQPMMATKITTIVPR